MSALHINITERKISNRQGPLCESNSRYVRSLTFIIPLGSMPCSQKLLYRETYQSISLPHIVNTEYKFWYYSPYVLRFSKTSFCCRALHSLFSPLSSFLSLLHSSNLASFRFPKFYVRVRFAVPIVTQLFTFLQLLILTCIELFFFSP